MVKAAQALLLYIYSTRNLEIPLTRVVQSRFPCLTKHAAPLSFFACCELKYHFHLSDSEPPPRRLKCNPPQRSYVVPSSSRRGKARPFSPFCFSFFPRVVVSRRRVLKIRNKTHHAAAGGMAICGKCEVIRRFRRNFMNL